MGQMSDWVGEAQKNGTGGAGEDEKRKGSRANKREGRDYTAG